jgi:F-type H+-transporting ATPase subunit delta
MRVRLDRSLIGGMIVKIGSRMIDTTIKSKLVKLQNIMKEVN